MRKRRLNWVAVGIGLSCIFGPAASASMDLSGWTPHTYNPDPSPEGIWELSNNNQTVTQTVEPYTSYYLYGPDLTEYSVSGTFGVDGTHDDDMLGLIFGYQDTSHFYVFDWKQGYQVSETGVVAQEGFALRRIAAPAESDLTMDDFWASAGSQFMDVLASNFGSGKGWADYAQYDFFLDFAPGSFSVRVEDAGNALWDVTVDDDTYTQGRFGLYNFSQDRCQYSNLEIDAANPVPEPSTMILLSLAAVGIVAHRRFRR